MRPALYPLVPDAVSLTALITAGGAFLLIVVGASISFLYLVTCRIWPFRGCRRCKGLGRLRAPNGKAWRDCPRCKGTGRRLRIGRRLWNHAERAKRNAI
ncbi:hypothetical protein ACXC9Q_18720 [Kribbella sp. CWNU-51]